MLESDDITGIVSLRVVAAGHAYALECVGVWFSRERVRFNTERHCTQQRKLQEEE